MFSPVVSALSFLPLKSHTPAMLQRSTASQFLRLILIGLTVFAVRAAALSPDQERGTFHFADDSLTIELVASEPNVISPVAIAWDAKGRMLVAEMMDYPLGPGTGQIR